VVASIRKLVGGCQTTTLLVTHDMELAREADEIVVLGAGRLVARGSYTELARSPAFRRLAGELSPPLSLLQRAQARLGT